MTNSSFSYTDALFLNATVGQFASNNMHDKTLNVPTDNDKMCVFCNKSKDILGWQITQKN